MTESEKKIADNSFSDYDQRNIRLLLEQQLTTNQICEQLNVPAALVNRVARCMTKSRPLSKHLPTFDEIRKANQAESKTEIRYQRDTMLREMAKCLFGMGIGQKHLRYVAGLTESVVKTCEQAAKKSGEYLDLSVMNANGFLTKLDKSSNQGQILTSLFFGYYYRIGGKSIFDEDNILFVVEAHQQLMRALSGSEFRPLWPGLFFLGNFIDIAKEIREHKIEIRRCPKCHVYYTVYRSRRYNSATRECPFCRFLEPPVRRLE